MVSIFSSYIIKEVYKSNLKFFSSSLNASYFFIKKLLKNIYLFGTNF